MILAWAELLGSNPPSKIALSLGNEPMNTRDAGPEWLEYVVKGLRQPKKAEATHYVGNPTADEGNVADLPMPTRCGNVVGSSHHVFFLVPLVRRGVVDPVFPYSPVPASISPQPSPVCCCLVQSPVLVVM